MMSQNQLFIERLMAKTSDKDVVNQNILDKWYYVHMMAKISVWSDCDERGNSRCTWYMVIVYHSLATIQAGLHGVPAHYLEISFLNSLNIANTFLIENSLTRLHS